MIINLPFSGYSLTGHLPEKQLIPKTVSRHINHNLTDILTPVNAEKLEEYLTAINYDKTEQEFLVSGFTQGFNIGYEGPQIRQSKSANIPFTVRDKFELWEKLMKEVKTGRVAGPFSKIPYENWIHPPIGLVPKAGNKTRLIFHL